MLDTFLLFETPSQFSFLDFTFSGFHSYLKGPSHSPLLVPSLLS